MVIVDTSWDPLTPRPKVDMKKSIVDLLNEMDISDCWDDAELWTIYGYVRGSKLLAMPESLKACLVTHAC